MKSNIRDFTYLISRKRKPVKSDKYFEVEFQMYSIKIFNHNKVKTNILYNLIEFL